ncbi:uncharacterized protein Dana_GF10745 [Drosophila ananassae]|uniref:Uncharacterized protein n=1 Tax=Drosophila ananassae TaxID=7217 RepID=B3M745_DROAN|nr:uncharacterized protein LOC6493612 [Drosophila ananassae]EDV40910.1 uncharacterized protein Dana_GF10745 [Drosophila ananassae]
MRLFVALVCVSFVACATAQWPLRGKSGLNAQVKLAVEPPSLLVKNAAILPSLQLSDTVKTQEIPKVSAGKRSILPYIYPSYWPDYGVPTNGWYPGGWNSGYSNPGYWGNNWYDYGAGFYPRRRLVKPLVSASPGSIGATGSIGASGATGVTGSIGASGANGSSSSSGSTSSTTTTTTTTSDVVPALDASLTAAVVPDVVPLPDVVPVADPVVLPLVAEPLLTTQVI